MRRNIVSSLFEHETIATTIQKAKEVKPFAEKLITLAKKGTLPARRRAISMLGNRDIVVDEDGRTVKKGTVVGKLFSELGPRYLDRPGGYTRIIRRSLRRLGDNGELVLLQLIGPDEGPKKKAKTTSRKRSAGKPKKEKVAGVATAEPVEPEEAVEVQEAVEAEVEQAPESGDAAKVEQEEAVEAQEAEQAEAEGSDKTDEARADTDEDAKKQ
jgi:large subunit ribosomal protein L17